VDRGRPPDQHDGPESVVATYRFAEGAADVAAEAQAFAIGQSVGTWVPLPGLTAQLLERHGARVLSVVPSGNAGPDVKIAFPLVNFRDGGLPMLMTTLLGNDPSTGIAATMVDLALPPGYAREFGGPRLGIAGWRARLGVHDRPLLLNPMKPCIGLSPEATAAIAAEVARGGVDLVKDDEVLADTPFSHVAERSRAVSAALDQVAAETGHRARYVVSITGRARTMRDHVRAARENGADGVMVAAFMVGLDAVHEVVEELDGALPVIAHTAGLDLLGGHDGLSLAPEILVGRLARLAGADAVLIGSPWARRSTPEPVWTRMAALLRDGWSELAPAFPVVGGGIVPEQLGDVVRLLGVDAIVTAGGAINGHPEGAETGARAMMRALGEAVAAAGATA
jgi:2,3-diketo-5-methylthiopentyl-1-phosphate enolase